MMDLRKEGAIMDDKKRFAEAFESMWGSLTDEQKSLILQKQKNEAEKAAVKAKRENTKRLLDRQDKAKADALLKAAGCGDVKMPLNNVRVLALRWILADSDMSVRFGMYIKRQLEK